MEWTESLEPRAGLFQRDVILDHRHDIGVRAHFVDARTVECENGARLGARRILIATGGRPERPDIPGAGLGGVSDDFGLANAYAHQRTLRLADGPDEVHARAIARIELAKHSPASDPGFSSGDIGVSR